MPLFGSRIIDRPRQPQLLGNGSRTHVKVLHHNPLEPQSAQLAGAVGLDEDAQGLGDANGIGQLDEAALREACVYE